MIDFAIGLLVGCLITAAWVEVTSMYLDAVLRKSRGEGEGDDDSIACPPCTGQCRQGRGCSARTPPDA